MVKLGFPLSKNPDKVSLSQSIEAHFEHGITALQINVTSTHNGKPGIPFEKKEAEQIRNHRKKYGGYIVSHGKYTYNFARKDCTYQIDQLIDELRLASQMDADVILHQGKNVKEEQLTRLEALHNYVKHISEALERTYDLKNGVLLENSCKQGTELGYSLDELIYIYEQFDDSLKPRVGFCLDLCHVFVAGELDVRKADDVELFFTKFDSSIGLDKLKCIHYNDSSIPFGGCHDEHGDQHTGYISNPLLGGSVEGFKRIAEIAHEREIAIIFETPCIFENYHNYTDQDSQRMWQIKFVQAWAHKDDTSYIYYVARYPNISQVAYEYYTSKNKSKSKKKAKSKDEKSKPLDKDECACSCSHEQAQPKIKIQLKLDKKEQSDVKTEKIKIQLKKLT